MQTEKDWKIWKDKCALKLCPPDIQCALIEFAGIRFNKLASTYASTTNVSNIRALAVPPEDAWHYFESGLRLRDSRDGKSYKKWLFARAGIDSEPTLDLIQGGATLLMRNIVCEHLRKEFSNPRSLSLDCSSLKSSQTLHDLLPASLDTLEEVETRELRSIANTDAETIFADLKYAERVALLARELNLPLNHPNVLLVAHRGKTAVAEAYEAVRSRLAEHIRTRHDKEDSETLAQLSILAFTNLKERSILWGKTENQCANLFLSVED
jgi:hypothetical protein